VKYRGKNYKWKYLKQLCVASKAFQAAFRYVDLENGRKEGTDLSGI